MNPYLADILSQPDSLRLALQKSNFASLEPLAHALDAGRIDRIVLTGMGASFYGLYPAWLHLAAAGLPALWVDAAELVHHAPRLVGEKALVWAASQSGRSAEVTSLLEKLEVRPAAALIAITNDPESPLARAGRDWPGSCLLPIFAEPEASVSTRTYLNTLAISQVAAQILIPGGFSRSSQEIQAAATADLLQASDRVEDYLENRWVALDQIETFLNSLPPSSPPAGPLITLIGRGASLAAAYCGALYIQEAAKIPALGFQAGEFRHGPLEFASPSAGFWVFSGFSGTEASRLNRKLFDELRSYGAPARLLESAQGGSGQPASEGLLAMPAVSGLGLPLGEIVPIQLLSFRLAERQGILPGSFRHIGKITSVE